jgi:hypothetical protein
MQSYNINNILLFVLYVLIYKVVHVTLSSVLNVENNGNSVTVRNGTNSDYTLGRIKL